MTISDSLPIQFWDIDEETFNEKAVCGLSRQECFCQPRNCSDPITDQFEDESGLLFQMVLYDEIGSELMVVDYEEILSGVYSASFTPDENSPSICQRIQIKRERNYGELENGTFTSNLTPWTNVGSGENWNWSANQNNSALIQFITAGLDINSKYLTQDFNTFTGVLYTVTCNAPLLAWVSGSAVECFLNVYFSNGSSRDLAFSFQFDDGVTSINETQQFTALNNYDKVEIYVILTATDNPTELNFFLTSISVTADNQQLAQSDCIDLKESHPCTTLIEYSNSSNFDGIEYETSPQPTFYLRIPAMFHEEDNPMTQEDLELSNGVIVTLRQSLQEKRLLETGYMPNYMHKKLQKVLMHEEITIDGTQWKRRDAYDADPIKKYNLKKAEVLLTKYNSVEKNTI